VLFAILTEPGPRTGRKGAGNRKVTCEDCSKAACVAVLAVNVRVIM